MYITAAIEIENPIFQDTYFALASEGDVGWDSVAGIATRYGLDGPWIKYR
jgi:hypothetical protein